MPLQRTATRPGSTLAKQSWGTMKSKTPLDGEAATASPNNPTAVLRRLEGIDVCCFPVTGQEHQVSSRGTLLQHRSCNACCALVAILNYNDNGGAFNGLINRRAQGRVSSPSSPSLSLCLEPQTFPVCMDSSHMMS